MSQHQFRLTYFDIHGLAEPIRNAFRLSKIPFEDVRVQFSEWQDLKKSHPEKFIFGQMPILEIDSVPFAQSNALLRYVGKLTGLYPTDPLEALKVDEVIDALGDISKKLSASASLPEPERIAARQKLSQEFIKPHLTLVEKRVSFGTENKLITIADLVVANDLNNLRSGRMDGVDTSIPDHFPTLNKIADHVKAALAQVQ